MTPAIDLLKKARAEHKVLSYSHDPKAPSYGLEAAEKLGLDPQRVFKTLLAATEKGELLVAVVPVIGSLDLKALAHAAGARPIRRRRSGPPATWWAGSARWGRRSACVPSSMKARGSTRASMSAQDGAGWKWSWRPRCWPS